MKRRIFLSGAAAAGATVVASALPKPALAQKKIEAVMVTTWPRDFPALGTGAQRLAKRINDATDGRIKITYYAAGEKVGAFASFDEVASGKAQMYHAADYYWKGKHPAWAYFTSVPFGLTCNEMNAWLQFGGGQELWDKVAGNFGLKNVRAGNTGVQMGGWFRKEINSADDLKGLKMRIPGLGGDVMAKLGASPVSLPGGQIYENLVSGAIDATEWAGPYNDKFMKFYEAASYYYYPGMHEPGSMLALGMNASWWGKLSKNDQVIVEALAAAENDIMMAEFNGKSGPALKELVEDHGVKLREFNDDVYDAFYEGAQAVFEATRSHSALAKEVDDGFRKARAELGAYTRISEQAYLIQRNRVLGL